MGPSAISANMTWHVKKTNGVTTEGSKRLILKTKGPHERYDQTSGTAVDFTQLINNKRQTLSSKIDLSMKHALFKPELLTGFRLQHLTKLTSPNK